MSTYYVTIDRDGERILRRKPFDDYAAAIAETSKYYQARFGRCVLSFETEVINGEFARSYVELNRPESLGAADAGRRYSLAAKHSNAFSYDASYRFIIESDAGIRDVQQYLADQGE